ncbi:MAG: hypothetical protein CK545_01495 [Actinobacteria bacterium]|nr:MAG: hypothetical protein CK545_01495 [Actinomycetota bacterium]
MVITLSNVELPGGRVVALAEIPLACCALEAYAFRATCRESLSSPSEVLLLVSGTLTTALSSQIQAAVAQFQTYLPELPHRIVAVGACATSGGPYWDSPTVIPGLAEMGIEPDLFIAGCPPSPQAISNALAVVRA